MRIVFVTSLDRGGPIEHTLCLSGALAAEGADVGVVCADPAVTSRFASIGVQARHIPLRRSFDPSAARRIWRYARGADVVHAQDRRSGLWVRLGPRPRPGGIRVYTVHGLPDEYLPPPVGPSYAGLRATIAYRGLDAFLCRRGEAVIVPSRAVERLLVERLRFPPRKLAVIPGGVAPPPSSPVEPNGTLVGTVNTLEPVKGLDVFLRAAARLSDARPNLRFAIIGTGSAQDRLRALAESLGIAARVEFPGHLPKDQALERLSVFVLSSYMENCPMALLEAMAAGVPAVATRVGGVPEIAVDGTAQLVEPGDEAALAAGIDRLLDDPALRERQALAARERILRRFTAAESARATLALYEALLGPA
jgi:glycosyltransferase involved in cell wall biosynthesis